MDENVMEREQFASVPWLLNAFSINMIEEFPAQVGFSAIEIEEARELLEAGFMSAVGHPATAEVLTSRLGLQVEANRVNVTLRPGDVALVAQVNLPRLAEGQVLTADEVAAAPVRFFQVKIIDLDQIVF